MDMQFQLLSWFLMRKLVPPEDGRLVKGHYKHRGGHSRLVQEYCLICFSGFVLTTLDIHGRNWGGCHVIPTSPLSATPSVLVLPAISCHLPDFIVGDLSLVFTTDLSKGLLTISETLRKAYDLFVILARSQFLQSLGLLAWEPGGGTPCRSGQPGSGMAGLLAACSCPHVPGPLSWCGPARG